MDVITSYSELYCSYWRGPDLICLSLLIHVPIYAYAYMYIEMVPPSSPPDTLLLKILGPVDRSIPTSYFT